MLKFLKKIFSFDFWFSIEGNSVYDLQEGEEEQLKQLEFLKFFNKNYLERLIELGDNPEKPREVFHYLHFRKNADIENFASKIRQYDFIAIGKYNILDSENYNIGYKVMRIDKTDVRSVEDFIYLLWKFADENNAFYKGWETVPVKEN